MADSGISGCFPVVRAGDVASGDGGRPDGDVMLALSFTQPDSVRARVIIVRDTGIDVVATAYGATEKQARWNLAQELVRILRASRPMQVAS